MASTLILQPLFNSSPSHTNKQKSSMADVDMTDVPVKKAVGKSKDDGKKRFEVKKVNCLPT